MHYSQNQYFLALTGKSGGRHLVAPAAAQISMLFEQVILREQPIAFVFSTHTDKRSKRSSHLVSMASMACSGRQTTDACGEGPQEGSNKQKKQKHKKRSWLMAQMRMFRRQVYCVPSQDLYILPPLLIFAAPYHISPED